MAAPVPAAWQTLLSQVASISGKIPMEVAKLRTIRSDHNNWVIPGYVMAGPFPGFDGVNYGTEESAAQNLRAILADGIDTFVCLCDELPPQTDLLAQPKPHPYFPKYKSYAHIMQDSGMARDYGVNAVFEYAPIQDQRTPSCIELAALLSKIMGHLASGRRVFIHCAGGHGRTGLVVACLLLCIYGDITADYALYFTQAAHDSRRSKDERTRHFVLPVQSPNSPEQFSLVRRFAEFLSFARGLM